MKLAAPHGRLEHRAWADDVLLPHELGKMAGPHASGEGRFSGRLLVGQGEEIHGVSSVVRAAVARMRGGILRA
jgi:hypothetical protein